MTPRARLVRAIALVGALAVSPGCVIVALHPFYAESALVLDDRLAGRWHSVEDNVVVTIERGEWRSYRIVYEHPIDKRSVTGYLFKAGDQFFVDLLPVRGEDPGPFLLSGHALVRLSFGQDELQIAPLDFDVMTRAIANRTAPAELLPVVTERGQIALTAERAALSRWLSALKPDASVWANHTTLTRVK